VTDSGNLFSFLQRCAVENCQGNANVNGRETKSCPGLVFHLKLGTFSAIKEVHGANACPCLRLKSIPCELKFVHGACVKRFYAEATRN
jgi:hypothetical protein